MSDEPGVYFFKTRLDAGDALMGWLGIRFDEDADLVLLTVDGRFVGSRSEGGAGYEVISRQDVPREAIIGYEAI